MPLTGNSATNLISVRGNEFRADDTFPDEDNYNSKATPIHHDTLQLVSLYMALVSFIATMVSFYWFSRMRRSFRHDLILVLIQGDFLKSFWLLMFPIIDLAHGHVETNADFCQISGFFLTASIEICDIAVLLMALHGALFVFNPKRAGGQHGIYPYRRVAYVINAVFPFFMASMAFVDGLPGYSNFGMYCYLSTTRSWYLQYLSWAPRYFFFGAIILLKLATYIYVRVKLNRYRRRSSAAHVRIGRAPVTPPLECHGLAPPMPEPDRRRSSGRSRCSTQRAAAVIMVVLAYLPRALRGGRRQNRIEGVRPATSGPNASQNAIELVAYTFPPAQTPAAVHGENDVGPRDSVASADRLEPPAPTHPRASRHGDNTLGRVELEALYLQPVTTAPTSRASNTETPTPPRSLQNMLAAFQSGPSRRPSEDPALSEEPILLTPILLEDSTAVSQRRDRTRRQLRVLFVYPIVYVLMWSVPFIIHALKYDGKNRSSIPLWLAVLGAVFLASQGLIDSVLFLSQEKPWQHVKGGFWQSFGELFKCSLFTDDAVAGGRTREEMHDDERFAASRRAEEAAVEAAVMIERQRSVTLVPERAPRMPKKVSNWWDVEVDGIYSSDEDVEQLRHTRRHPV